MFECVLLTKMAYFIEQMRIRELYSLELYYLYKACGAVAGASVSARSGVGGLGPACYECGCFFKAMLLQCCSSQLKFLAYKGVPQMWRRTPAALFRLSPYEGRVAAAGYGQLNAYLYKA